MNAISDLQSSKSIILDLLQSAYPNKIPDKLFELAQKVESAENSTDKDNLYLSLVSKAAEIGNTKLAESILALEDYEKKDQGYFSLAHSYIINGHFEEVRKITGVMKNIFLKDKIYEVAIEALNINSKFNDAQNFAEKIKDNKKKKLAIESINEAKKNDASALISSIGEEPLEKLEEKRADTSSSIPISLMSGAQVDKINRARFTVIEPITVDKKELTELKGTLNDIRELLQSSQSRSESKESECSSEDIVTHISVISPREVTLGSSSVDNGQLKEQVRELKNKLVTVSRKKMLPVSQTMAAHSISNVLVSTLDNVVERIEQGRRVTISSSVNQAAELEGIWSKGEKLHSGVVQFDNDEGRGAKENLPPLPSGPFTDAFQKAKEELNAKPSEEIRSLFSPSVTKPNLSFVDKSSATSTEVKKRKEGPSSFTSPVATIQRSHFSSSSATKSIVNSGVNKRKQISSSSFTSPVASQKNLPHSAALGSSKSQSRVFPQSSSARSVVRTLPRIDERGQKPNKPHPKMKFG